MGFDITDLLILCLALGGMTGLALLLYLIRRLSGGGQAQQLLQEELRAGRGEAEARTRVMERRLRSVEQLPSAEDGDLFQLATGNTEEGEPDPADDSGEEAGPGSFPPPQP